jgi:hypothetical protein
LACYYPDGCVDAGFGPDVSGNVVGVAISPDGDIIVAGMTSNNFASEFALAYRSRVEEEGSRPRLRGVERHEVQEGGVTPNAVPLPSGKISRSHRAGA